MIDSRGKEANLSPDACQQHPDSGSLYMPASHPWLKFTCLLLYLIHYMNEPSSISLCMLFYTNVASLFISTHFKVKRVHGTLMFTTTDHIARIPLHRYPFFFGIHICIVIMTTRSLEGKRYIIKDKAKVD